MGSNQTYKLLHSKGNHKQNEKTAYRRKHLQMKQPIRDSFSKIHKQFMQFYVQKKKKQSKNGQKI